MTYNHHMSQDYASDVLLEPIIWIVDNFTDFLGPVKIPFEHFQSFSLIQRLIECPNFFFSFLFVQ